MGIYASQGYSITASNYDVHELAESIEDLLRVGGPAAQRAIKKPIVRALLQVARDYRAENMPEPGHELRASGPITPSSTQSSDDRNLPELMTVAQATPHLPWKREETTRRKIRNGELRANQTKPIILLNRDDVLAIKEQDARLRSTALPV